MLWCVDCSPFKTRILPSFDASKVVVSGDGVRPRGVLASLPTSFVIDTREAGLADLDVVIQVCNNRHWNELNAVLSRCIYLCFRQPKTCIDNIKEGLKISSVDIRVAAEMIMDRDKLRYIIQPHRRHRQ